MKKTLLTIIISGILFASLGVYAATTLASSSVSYDNKTSGGISTNVQGALDELYDSISTGNDYVTEDFNFSQTISKSNTGSSLGGNATINVNVEKAGYTPKHAQIISYTDPLTNGYQFAHSGVTSIEIEGNTAKVKIHYFLDVNGGYSCTVTGVIRVIY